MNLNTDWKWMLKKAWSIRLAALAGLLSGCEVVLPLFVDTLPRNIFSGLSILAAVAAGVARIVAQPKMERRARSRVRPDHAKADYD